MDSISYRFMNPVFIKDAHTHSWNLNRITSTSFIMVGDEIEEKLRLHTQ